MKYPLRVIGRHDGEEEGPLFICLCAMHGNEPAGVHAIKTVLTLLNDEPLSNPGFVFHGRLVGLIGNRRALHEGKRFIRQDMNRLLTKDHVDKVLGTSKDRLNDEDVEIKELISFIHQEIADYEPQRVIVLDLHSSSAEGGIFVITADNPESIRIGTELHAPVILDFAREISGTTLGYFTEENFDVNIVSVVFECGQHNEALSTNRAIAAIINCMRTIGSIKAEDVENKHDLLLMEYSRGLPKIARLIERCAISEEKSFILTRKFKNFEPVTAGQIIAFSGETPIKAQNDGLILLPRLQNQGNDGFFVVKPIKY